MRFFKKSLYQVGSGLVLAGLAACTADTTDLTDGPTQPGAGGTSSAGAPNGGADPSPTMTSGGSGGASSMNVGGLMNSAGANSGGGMNVGGSMSVGGMNTGGMNAGGTNTGGAGGMPTVPPGTFVERNGLLVFEAEHFTKQVNTEKIKTQWYEFKAGAAAPNVMCTTNVVCSGQTAPDCNEHGDCDGDNIDPMEASGESYLEALPDRRRTDEEAGTGNLGVVNQPADAPTVEYEVTFSQPGRYYVWARARGQGPAANGLHVGLDGNWPENDLIDKSSMRLQFGNGWQWTQNRRGGTQHTGVQGTAAVNVRDANVWLQIGIAGKHTIQFGMREDGLEIDKFILTTDGGFTPDGFGPAETIAE